MKKSKKILAGIALGLTIPAVMLGTGCVTANHEALTTWKSDETHHWHPCAKSNCDEQYDYDTHDWDNGTVKVTATSTQDGAIEFKCETCKKTKIETYQSQEKMFSIFKTASEASTTSQYFTYKRTLTGATNPSIIIWDGTYNRTTGIGARTTPEQTIKYVKDGDSWITYTSDISNSSKTYTTSNTKPTFNEVFLHPQLASFASIDNLETYITSGSILSADINITKNGDTYTLNIVAEVMLDGSSQISMTNTYTIVYTENNIISESVITTLNESGTISGTNYPAGTVFESQSSNFKYLFDNNLYNSIDVSSGYTEAN